MIRMGPIQVFLPFLNNYIQGILVLCSLARMIWNWKLQITLYIGHISFMFCNFVVRIILISFLTSIMHLNICIVLGFPILGVEWQKMENPDFRLSMGMGPDVKGVCIKRIEPTAAESNVLKPSDIILSFDGVKIANDGTSKHE